MIPLRSHFPQEGIIIPSADEVRDVRTKSLCWVQKHSYCAEAQLLLWEVLV